MTEQLSDGDVAVKGTPMVPIHQKTLDRIVHWLDKAHNRGA